jgi:ABC-2 type transport system ATP-binding protein
MTQILAKVNNLSKQFALSDSYSLKDINASIQSGIVTGLVGPDGSGKTTLIRLIAGLLLPTAGNVEVKGCDSIKESYRVQSYISYMPQKFGLYEDLSVIENLNLYADLRNVSGDEREQTFKKLLEFTDLKNFTRRLAGNLSGGMKQKLGLACSLIKKPDLLLLDEPSVGVDPISRRELWKMVKGLVDEGMGVIWSTAYLDEAEKCDHVLLLNHGELLFKGHPDKLHDRVKDRVYQVQNITKNNRTILATSLNHPDIIDGVIQGRNIRLVTRKNAVLPAKEELSLQEECSIIAVPPRFEDAFIDILGGGPGGTSILADNLQKIQISEKEVILAHNLTKQFGEFTAVNNVSFSVTPGEIFGLLGPNGAGKSTIFKMMCGLLKPSNGKAQISGLDLMTASSQARARIGYMAQKFSLYDTLSIHQNLKFFAGVYGLKNKHRKEMIHKMLEIFDLNQYKNNSAVELPLGFKQRLALACAVMHNPDVLFLDEPTSGVDPITRREFWTHINGMVQKDVTIMITTHFMDEAEYCDRIGLVYKGQIIAIDSPDKLKKSVVSEKLPDPTLEDAFIELIKDFDRQQEKEAA